MRSICLLTLLFLFNGCAAATYGVQYSVLRSVGDTGTTIYLDNTGSWMLQKPIIENFVDDTLAWLNANQDNISDNDALKDALRELVPPDFHFLVDLVVGKFGSVPIHNARLAKNFFIGVKNSVDYYNRFNDDPVFQGKTLMKHTM